ncbi:hypothetical protein [uncultured Limosilactobacillus sp.]|nr:hypothetical protein [uncultured Limosilactobacillus sp.]
MDNVHHRPRRNFRSDWLSSSEVVDRLIVMSDDLQKAYNYYQTLVDAIS